MRQKQIYTQQMLARVVDFGKNHSELFPSKSVAGELLASIGQAVTKLSAHSSNGVSGKGLLRTNRATRTAARAALMQQLERIDQTARALDMQHFFMPRNRSDEAWIATATAWAKDAAPSKAEFVKQGLAPQFLDELREAVKTLSNAIVDESHSNEGRRAAEAGYENTLKQVRADLRRFDVLVQNTLHDNPEVMAKWNVARRVGRPPSRRKRGPATTTPDAHPPAVPTPSAPPAA